MMDFFVREAREIIQGPMVIIRFGTCGSLDPLDNIGDFIVTEKACLVTRNVDAFIHDTETTEKTACVDPKEFYRVSKFSYASMELSQKASKPLLSIGLYLTGVRFPS